MKKCNLIFFGTSDYSVMVLQTLIASGFTPALIVTTPDKPAGKHLVLTPPPVKVFAQSHNLPFIQPEKLKDPALLAELKSSNFDGGIVVAYGKIIPQEIIDVPKTGLLNLHASLLPKLRGASPIETAILQDKKNTGVTIMQVDAEMDHGPIVAQQEVSMQPWPPTAPELGKNLVRAGADLLVKIIPEWLSGNIKATEQDHSQATYTKKIEKKDGEIDLSADPYQNFLKIQAYREWPRTFLFVDKHNVKVRVIIADARFNEQENTLEITRVIPEGKKDMSYEDFKRSL